MPDQSTPQTAAERRAHLAVLDRMTLFAAVSAWDDQGGVLVDDHIAPVVDQIAGRRVSDALAPIQALVAKYQEWHDYTRQCLAEATSDHARRCYEKALSLSSERLDPLLAALAVAGVDAAPNETATPFEVAFRFQDGEVFKIDDLRAGRGLFDDAGEVPVIVCRRVGDDEWLELGEEFRAEYEWGAAVPSGHEQEGDGR